MRVTYYKVTQVRSTQHVAPEKQADGGWRFVVDCDGRTYCAYWRPGTPKGKVLRDLSNPLRFYPYDRVAQAYCRGDAVNISATR